MNKNRLMVIAVFVLLAAFSRLIPHPPNFTPVLAIALFAGAKISDRWLSTLLPLVILFLSDIFIGFHSTMPFVYAATLACVFMGWGMQQKVTAAGTIGRSIAGSLNFFFITNIGVWISGGLYEKSVQGLIQCFAMALPFFHNSVLSTLIYSALLFVGFELLEKKNPQLAWQTTR